MKKNYNKKQKLNDIFSGLLFIFNMQRKFTRYINSFIAPLLEPKFVYSYRMTGKAKNINDE